MLQRMSRMRAHVFAAGLLLALLTFAYPPVLSAAGASKRVLLLDSYGRNVAPTSTVISVFRTEVSSRSAEPVDVHEASLEMARFAQPEQELPFVSFLRERFSTHKPDLVVTVGSGTSVVIPEKSCKLDRLCRSRSSAWIRLYSAYP